MILTTPDARGVSRLITQRMGRFDSAQLAWYIGDKEAYAACRFMLEFPDVATTNATLLHVDSTVLFHALRKGYAPRPECDRMLRETIGRRNTQMSLCLVPSACNWADKPSRHRRLMGNRFDMRNIKVTAKAHIDWYGERRLHLE
jgi:hypothetical protein